MDKNSWDLSKICKDNAEFYLGIGELKTYIKKQTQYKGKLGDARLLREFLNLERKVSKLSEQLYVYIKATYDTDLSSSKVAEQLNILDGILTESSQQLAFATPELVAQPEGYLEGLCNDPRFKDNAFGFKQLLRQRKYILSAKEEEIIAAAGNFAGEFDRIFSVLENADFKFEDAIDSKGEPHKLTHAKYGVFMAGSDRQLRKSAFENYYAKFLEHDNTIATNFIASLKKDHFYANIRGYAGVLESKLYGENIDKKIYQNLIEQVDKHLPMAHSYFQIKKNLMKLGDFGYYDLYASIAPGESKQYTFKEAVDLLKTALAPMGVEYIGLLDRAVKERWIDIYPKENKRSGAYQWGAYGSTPIILLNFEGRLEDVFTLAHEFGHAGHSFLSDAANPIETAGYTIFLAEIASTVNEVLLLKHLYLQAQTNAQKIYLLDRYLSMFRTTIFRQTQFAAFEQYAHDLVKKNEGISKEKLSEYYGNLSRRFHGAAVMHHDNINIEWMRIPHFYSSFYVYKYATGLISAINFAYEILAGNTEKYFEFLKSGGSDFSTKILERAGIDLASDKPFKTAFADMMWALEELVLCSKQ